MPLLRFSRHRTLSIVVSVVLLHGLALWGLQAGLLQRAATLVQEIVVPVSVITEPPVVPQTPPKALAPMLPAKTPAPAAAPRVPAAPSAAPLAPPQIAVPQAVAEAAPSATAPTGSQQAPAAPAAAPAPASAAVQKVELPTSSADYLHNPKPLYPKLSERRGEQGTVLLSVLVGADGRAKEVSVKSSSGYERLDQAAREAVLGWTFVPGKRNGAAVEMSVDVPIRFKPSE